MENTTLGINAAGNPVVFDNDFLAMLGGAPATTTLLEEADDEPEPGPSGGDDATPTFDPELLGLTGDKRALTFIDCMRQAFEGQTDKVREKWAAAADKLIDDTIEAACPSVKDRRARLDKLYRTYVHYQDQTLPHSKFWQEATFRKHWTRFLIALLTCSRGRDTERVRANTFRQWCTDLIWLVGRYMVNTDGIRVGTNALTAGVCIEFELSREALPRLWIGHLELLLIYQAAIRTSEKHGRASILQSILCTSIVFQIGARIGSLGWSNEQYRDEGKFMKCKDVVVEVMDYGVWDSEITVANRKGWNSAVDTTRPLTYRITAVTKTHNLWFDTPSLLLLYLLHRGALEDCETIEDLFKYKKQFFVIKEEFREKPLFLERTERGLDLKEDCPASANGLTFSFKALGRLAGFIVTNYHALRRDGGTFYGIVFGAQAAQTVLGHAEAETTYKVCYSKGTLSLPLSEARMGLLDHTLSLPQKIGIQRYRREGLAASALLHAGFKFSEPAPLEEGDETVEGGPGAPTEAAAPAPAEPVAGPSTERKRGVRGKPNVELTEEQEEKIQALEGYWDEFYSLFPPEAMTRFGSRVSDKLKLIRETYEDSPICQQNADRILVLDGLIHVTQKDKKDKARNLRRKARAKVERKRKAAEKANPTVHAAEDMKKARKHMDTMAKLVNLPKPSEQIEALGAIRDMPHFGEGLLSEECRTLLAKATIVEELREMERNEENEREDRLENERDDQDENSSPFKDVDDLKFLDADLVETKRIFLTRLAEPLFADAVYDQLAKAGLFALGVTRLICFQENGGQYPCRPCRALPEEQRPRVVGNKLGQTMFPDRGKLHRHEESVHTRWFDLIQYMLTEDPEIFKCPTQDCLFRGDTVDEVREHCVTECEEQELYASLERAHEKEQEVKRIAAPSRDGLRRRKNEEKLRGPGLQLRQNIFEGTKTISDTSPEEALRLASVRGIPEDRVLPHLRGLAALNERARSSINEEGVIKDPYVKMSMERISKSLLTPELDADIDARLAEKE